jgi:hypothetical protein
MRSLLLIAASSVMLACSGDDTGPPDGSADAAPVDATTDAGPDAAPSDATVDTATDAPSDAPNDVQEAGACLLDPTDSGTCNALVASGSGIVPTCPSGTAPTASGGTIADGRYVMTSTKFYGSSGACPTDSEAIDWVVCGTQWETVSSGNNADYNLNFTATVQSPNLTLDQTCTSTATANWTYDATSTSLVFYIPIGNTVRVDTFAKQ